MADFLLPPAKLIEAHLKPRTQQLHNIFCKTHHVRRKTLKKIFYPRLRTHNLPSGDQNQNCANKNDSSFALNCPTDRSFPLTVSDQSVQARPFLRLRLVFAQFLFVFTL